MIKVCVLWMYVCVRASACPHTHVCVCVCVRVFVCVSEIAGGTRVWSWTHTTNTIHTEVHTPHVSSSAASNRSSAVRRALLPSWIEFCPALFNQVEFNQVQPNLFGLFGLYSNTQTRMLSIVERAQSD